MIQANISSIKVARKVNAIIRYLERELVPRAQSLAMKDIITKTKRGVDADNKRLHKYSDGHARRRRLMGLPVTPKDLTMTGSMLRGLHVVNDTITVKDADIPKARGQMSHPDWSYHHNFLAAGKDTVERIEKDALRELGKL